MSTSFSQGSSSKGAMDRDIGETSVRFVVGSTPNTLNPAVAKSCPEVMTIRGKVVNNMDLNSTWLEIIKNEFGVDLDPEACCLHKYSREGPKKAKKHDLREQAFVLLNTFTSFCVGPKNVHVAKKLGGNPVNKPAASGGRVKRASTAMVPSGHYDESVVSPPPLQGRRSLRPRMSVLALPPPLPPPPRVLEQHNSINSDNFDGRSTHSNDSQLQDLEQQGVRVDENLKAKVYERTRKKYTNSTFLRARNEMLGLKRKQNSTRWAKVTSELPTVMAIFQDLFGA